MMTKILTNREYVIKIALDAYPNKTMFNEDEFRRDFFRFYIIRKMARRFLSSGTVSDKLLLNNIIICLNVFGIEASNLIWKLICCDDEFGVIKSCLIFLNSLNPSDPTPHHKPMLDILKDIKHRYTISPNN